MKILFPLAAITFLLFSGNLFAQGLGKEHYSPDSPYYDGGKQHYKPKPSGQPKPSPQTATPSASAEGSLEIVQYSLHDEETGPAYATPSAPGATVPVFFPPSRKCAYITVRYNSTSLWRSLKASDFIATFSDGREKKGETLRAGGKSKASNKIRNDELLKCYVCFGKDKQDIIDIVAE